MTDALRELPIDGVGEYGFDVQLRKPRSGELVRARVVWSVALDSGKKVIRLRSALAVVNDTDMSLEVFVVSPAADAEPGDGAWPRNNCANAFPVWPAAFDSWAPVCMSRDRVYAHMDFPCGRPFAVCDPLFVVCPPSQAPVAICIRVCGCMHIRIHTPVALAGTSVGVVCGGATIAVPLALSDARALRVRPAGAAFEFCPPIRLHGGGGGDGARSDVACAPTGGRAGGRAVHMHTLIERAADAVAVRVMPPIALQVCARARGGICIPVCARALRHMRIRMRACGGMHSGMRPHSTHAYVE